MLAAKRNIQHKKTISTEPKISHVHLKWAQDNDALNIMCNIMCLLDKHIISNKSDHGFELSPTSWNHSNLQIKQLPTCSNVY